MANAPATRADGIAERRGCISGALPMLRFRSSALANTSSSHSRITTPLHFGHFPRQDIDLEWTARLGEPVLGQRDTIMARAKKNSESTLGICRERSDRFLVAIHGKYRVWKRHRIWNIGSGSNRSRTSWTNSNHSFDSGTSVRFNLGGGHASVGNKEREEEVQLSTCCHRIRF